VGSWLKRTKRAALRFARDNSGTWALAARPALRERRTAAKPQNNGVAKSALHRRALDRIQAWSSNSRTVLDNTKWKPLGSGEVSPAYQKILNLRRSPVKTVTVPVTLRPVACAEQRVL